MPSVTALRRWLVFVALLRLLSGEEVLHLPARPILALHTPCLSAALPT